MQDAETALRDLIPVGVSAAEANVRRFYRGPKDVGADALATGISLGVPVRVVANHGRWVVECPDGDGGAQFASREDHRFMCIECLNASVGGMWYRVEWPDEVDEIEQILDARGPLEARNWTPAETVDDLRAETRKNTGRN